MRMEGMYNSQNSNCVWKVTYILQFILEKSPFLRANLPLDNYMKVEAVQSRRLEPFVTVKPTSFLHDYLEHKKIMPSDLIIENRPTQLRCVSQHILLINMLKA